MAAKDSRMKERLCCVALQRYPQRKEKGIAINVAAEAIRPHADRLPPLMV